MTILALQILLLITVNGLTSLLALLTLQAFCLLKLLEHTVSSKRFTCPLTLDVVSDRDS